MAQWLLLGAGLATIQACGWLVQWVCRPCDRRPGPGERWGTAWLVGVGTVPLLVSVWVALSGAVHPGVFRWCGVGALACVALVLVVWHVWYVHVPRSRPRQALAAGAVVVFVAALPLAPTVPTQAHLAPPQWLVHLDDADRVGTDDVTPLARWYLYAQRFPQPVLLPMAHVSLYAWMGRLNPDAVAVLVPLTWLAMAVVVCAKVGRHCGQGAAAAALALASLHLVVVVAPCARAGTGGDLVFGSLFSAGVLYLWSWMHSAGRGDSILGALLLGLAVTADRHAVIAAGAVVTGLCVYRLGSRRRSVGKRVRNVVLACLLTGAVVLACRHPGPFTGQHARSVVTLSTPAAVSGAVRAPGWGCLAVVGAVLAASVWSRRGRLLRPRNTFLAWVLVGYVVASGAVDGLLAPGWRGLGSAGMASVLVHVVPCAIVLVCSLHEQPTTSDILPPDRSDLRARRYD